MLFAVSCRTGDWHLSRSLGGISLQLDRLRDVVQGTCSCDKFKGAFVNFIDKEISEFDEGTSGGVLFLDLAADPGTRFQNISAEQMIEKVARHVNEAVDRSRRLSDAEKAQLRRAVTSWEEESGGHP